MDDILPQVRSAPGFVAGYWLEPAHDQGFALVLFETEQQAREAIPPATNWDAPGVTITGTEVRRVAVSGHATRKLPCIKEACGSQTKR